MSRGAKCLRNPSQLQVVPTAAVIVDLEKRKGLSKYYAYVIDVTLSDGCKYTVFRRFNEFHDVNQKLEERFPVDAGYFNYGQRTLPELPGKILFGRSAVRNVAEQRLPQLNEYLKKLLSLGNNIRYDSIVLGFLRENATDKEQADNRQSTAAVLSSGSPEQSPSMPRSIKTLSAGRTTAASLSKVSPTPQRPSRPPPLPHGTSSGRPSYLPSPKPASSLRPTTKPPVPPKATQNKPPARPPVMNVRHRVNSYILDLKDDKAGEKPPARPPPMSVRHRVDVGSYILDLKDDRAGESYSDVVRVLTECKWLLATLSLTLTKDGSSLKKDEWDDDETKGKITYYFNRLPRQIEVDPDMIHNPQYSKLRLAIEESMMYHYVTLNYKDKQGDLVELTDDRDMKLLLRDATGPKWKRDPLHAKWAIHVTKAGDYGVYNTHPYEQKR